MSLEAYTEENLPRTSYYMRLTDEQYSVIEALFNHNDWDLEGICEISSQESEIEKPDVRERDPTLERLREGEVQCEYCLCVLYFFSRGH